MIKFFRKIRQNSIKENKVSKYLLYAIGEIVLVMIGILLALQVNNWNENRKNNNLKQSYKENLIADLNKDIDNLERFNKINTAFEKDGFYLSDFMENKLIEIDTLRLINSIVSCAYIPNFTIMSSTYNDLINSNNIKLYNDIKLKRLLDEYYIQNEWITLFNNRILKTAWYDYRDEILKFHSATLYRDFYKSRLNASNPLDVHTKYKVKWNLIKKDEYLITQVEMILAYRIIIRDKFERKIREAKTILTYLELN